MSERNDGESFFRRLMAVRREERAPIVLAVAMFFCVLTATSLLRPIRDEMGLRGGARNLPYLWTATLGGTLAVSFAFASFASRRPRRTFTNAAYRAVGFTWLAFVPAVLSADGELGVWVARTFYVVHAVSNVFLVSLFWALIADLFDTGQARRLFGLVAVGGTLGAIAGTAITGSVARTGLAAWLIIPAALLIETAVRCANALAHRVATTSASSSATGAHAHAAALPLGGAAFDGLTLVARSPYLLAIAIYTFAFGVVQTFLTFQQNHIVEATLAAGEERTAYFAWTENAAQSLTLLVQLFVTGALLRRVGVVGGLLVLPVVGVLGFAALGAAHVGNASALALVTAFWVLWRGLNHATMRPSREALYVPTRREEKFKAKSFTDTFAFRGGDLAGAWSFNAFTLASAAFAAIPLAAAWGVLGFWLGRRQRELAARSNAPAESVPVDSVETAN